MTINNQSQPGEGLEAPERIYLPRDTDSDSWNILAKNPSRDWSTGEPANNIEYVRADLLQQPAAVRLIVKAYSPR